jgi:bifunctional non-homologous end joining protein LigD
MGLEKYRQKRDFAKTAEPSGKATKNEKSAGDSFVIQKHHARALHYDFRLELDGVLLSWAVPKGPSLDPHVKRLAVQTEDHPIEYGGFEGTIPAGEYGGGEVIVWDRGTWTPEGDARKDYAKGRLNFELNGEKLHGGFHLVRTAKKNGKKEQWLLFKATDGEARSDGTEIVDELPDSVLGKSKTGKKVAARTASPRATAARRAASTTAKKAPRRAGRRSLVPDFIEPELATLVDAAPEGKEYLHEIKLDGYRLLARTANGNATLASRRGNDWSSRLPGLVAALTKLGLDDSMLDGEVVVFRGDGVTDFQALQNSLDAGKNAACIYVVFDALYLDGEDLRGKPLLERKKALSARLTKKALGKSPVRLGDYVVGDGPTFFEQACKLGLEGILSKRVDSTYESRRTRSWLKVKCVSRQEFVIGGFTEPGGSRAHFGALLLGVQEADGLHYVGKVGTGFTAESLEELSQRMKKLEQKTAPFVNPPRGADARGVHWLAPELVGEVQFTERTKDGILRHPSFHGLRDDKAPRDVHTERPAKAEKAKSAASSPRAAKRPATKADEGPAFEVTHPERVLYAEQGITKGELAAYYSHVSSWILPHVVGRPLTLVRCPEGVGKQCFFQKHPSRGMSKAIDTIPIQEKKSKTEYMVIHDRAGLNGLVQMGALEIHVWGSRTEDVEKPDFLTFDLDPDQDLAWTRVVEAATELRATMAKIGLTAFVKTTGGKGLHVVVPVLPELPWDTAKNFAKTIVEAMAQRNPDRYLTTMTKAKRRGKIFLDYLRNGRGATAIVPYSTRAREGAPVAVPLTWKEMESSKALPVFDVRTVPDRLASLKEDPWKDFDAARASMTKAADGKLSS